MKKRRSKKLHNATGQNNPIGQMDPKLHNATFQLTPEATKEMEKGTGPVKVTLSPLGQLVSFGLKLYIEWARKRLKIK